MNIIYALYNILNNIIQILALKNCEYTIAVAVEEILFLSNGIDHRIVMIISNLTEMNCSFC